jgi:hypothetical protein
VAGLNRNRWQLSPEYAYTTGFNKLSSTSTVSPVISVNRSGLFKQYEYGLMPGYLSANLSGHKNLPISGSNGLGPKSYQSRPFSSSNSLPVNLKVTTSSSIMLDL